MGDKVTKNVQHYIELIYDEKSELNHIMDLEDRKKEACKKAKLDYDSEAVQNIVHMRDKVVSAQIHDYLCENNSNDYILLNSEQHLFWEIQRRLMEPLVASTDTEAVMKDLDLKTKLSEKSGTLLERLKERYVKIYKGRHEVKLAGEQIRFKRHEERLKKK